MVVVMVVVIVAVIVAVSVVVSVVVIIDFSVVCCHRCLIHVCCCLLLFV